MQPVQTDDIVGSIAEVVESIPCTFGEDGHRDDFLVELSKAVWQVVCNVGQVGQRELLEGGWGQFASP